MYIIYAKIITFLDPVTTVVGMTKEEFRAYMLKKQILKERGIFV